MKPRTQAYVFSVAEVFLPFIFFTQEKMGPAVLALFISVALTLVLLELFRRVAGENRARIFCGTWLAVLGGLSWALFQLPPYWIWSLYLLVPRAAWEPTAAQKKKPPFFGFRKYFKIRARELLFALTLTLFFISALAGLRQLFSGIVIWMLVILMLAIIESLAAQIRGKEA